MRLEQFISVFQENGFDDPSFWPELDDVTLKNALGLEKGNLLKWRRQFPEFYGNFYYFLFDFTKSQWCD